jgi:hypothetical protein
MKRTSLLELLRRVTPPSCMIAVGLILAVTLSGCVVVGTSSRGDWFIWPGGFGLLFVILIFLFLCAGEGEREFCSPHQRSGGARDGGHSA